MDQKDNLDDCVICFERIKNKKKYIKCCRCDSSYHFECMTTWGKRSKSRCCPTCQQKDLLVYNTKNSKANILSQCLPTIFATPFVKIYEFQLS